MVTACPLFFPLAKKRKKTDNLGTVIGLLQLFHKLGMVMWKKIVDG